MAESVLLEGYYSRNGIQQVGGHVLPCPGRIRAKRVTVTGTTFGVRAISKHKEYTAKYRYDYRDNVGTGSPSDSVITRARSATKDCGVTPD